MVKTSTRVLADSLPLYAPPSDRDHKPETLRCKYAVYFLAELSHDEAQALEIAVSAAEPTEHRSWVAPRVDLHGKTLRNVYDYHILERERDKSVHPLFFIVADQEEWRHAGVLIVYLDTGVDGEAHRIGIARCHAGMAGSWRANLDVGNMDWLDLKEQEAEEWGGDVLYLHTGEADASHMIFGWYSFVEKALPLEDLLEPEWVSKRPGERRVQMLGNFFPYDEARRWQSIRSERPRHCAAQRSLHSKLALVVTSADSNRSDAVTVLQLAWDSNVDDLSLPELREILPEVSTIANCSLQDAADVIQQHSETLQF